jgi:hypothetical protein
MASYGIWARTEHWGASRFRAVAAALPHAGAQGPKPGDIRMKVYSTRGASQAELGLLVHALATAVMSRGDEVVRLDVK